MTKLEEENTDIDSGYEVWLEERFDRIGKQTLWNKVRNHIVKKYYYKKKLREISVHTPEATRRRQKIIRKITNLD